MTQQKARGEGDVQLLPLSGSVPFGRASLLWCCCSLVACFEQVDGIVEDYGIAVNGDSQVRPLDVQLNSQVAWSPAGEEIYFVSAYFVSAPTVGPAPAQLQAVNLGDLSRRSLDAVDGHRWLLTRSPDGETLYYGFARRFSSALIGGELRRVSAHDGAEPETLAQNVASFALSPDGALVAVGSNIGQPLRLVPTSGGEARTLGSCNPISFSPDGTRLLCSEQATDTHMASLLRTELFIIDLESGANTSLPTDLPEASYPRLVRWGEEGIQLLHQRGGVVRLKELLSGADEVLWKGPSSSVDTTFAWSPNEVMASTTRCADPDGFFECGGAFDLHVIRLDTGRERVVARGLGAPWAGVFSDAEDRLAYEVDTNLYVAEVPVVE